MKFINIFLHFLLILNLNVVNESYSLSSIAEVLKSVETNNDPKAIGDGGKAYGILQIHKICIDDVNRYYGTNYDHQDAFDEICSEEIFNLYIKMGIERYKKKYDKNPTEQEVVRWWNGGIYSGHIRETTLKYYRRYLKHKKNLVVSKNNSNFKSKLNILSMNKLEFRGRIKSILPIQSGETANGEWKSIDFLVEETEGQYPQSAMFRLFGVDKVDNFQKYNKEGDDVIVSFNLKAREHNNKHFNSVDAWKVFKENATQQSSSQSTSISNDDDDLPF